MEKLTFDRAVELAREAIAERGEDFVYSNPSGETDWDGIPACKYVHGDQPGCIAGLMFQKHGVSLESLTAREGENASAVARELNLANTFSRDGSKLALFLNTLQHNQDGGKPWGEALKTALARVSE